MITTTSNFGCSCVLNFVYACALLWWSCRTSVRVFLKYFEQSTITCIKENMCVAFPSSNYYIPSSYIYALFFTLEVLGRIVFLPLH